MKKYIYILIFILILTRIFHKLQKIRNISEGELISFTHVLDQNLANCFIKHNEYQFYLTRCEDYKFLEKLVITGTVEASTDKDLFWQKTLKVQSIEVLQNEASSDKYWFNLILRPIISIRKFLLWKIHELWSASYGSLIAGFVFGFKENLPEEFLKEIKVTGMQHVVVASGFNISLVVILCDSFLSFFTKQKIIKLSLTLLAVLLYGLISGLSAPLSRAIIMSFMSLTAKNLFFRQYRPLFGLILAAVIMLIIKPLYIFDVSFQLSSSATLGIILVYPLLNKTGGWFNSLSTNNLSQITTSQNHPKLLLIRASNFFFDAFCTTISAQSFTLPLLLYHFGEFSLVSLVSNTFLLWLTPFITYAGFLVLVISILFDFLTPNLDVLTQLISFLAWLPSYFFIMGIKYFGRFETAYFTDIRFSAWWLIGIWIAVITLVKFSGKHYEKT